MWKNLNKATATNILAFLIMIAGYMILWGAASGLFNAPESRQTQIIQGIFGLMMLVAGFFFGASKNSKEEQK